MIDQLNMSGKTKVETDIERIKTFEPPEGYFLAFSGGKDSVVIKALADMAGVKYDAHYQITSVDPPELVRFVKTFDDVSMDRTHYKDGTPITMWNLIPMSTHQAQELERYPKFKQAYIRAFDRMLKDMEKDMEDDTWGTGDDVYQWWIKG